MDFLGVFLFCSAMFMLICLAVAVRGQILYHNEIYTYQQQTIADMTGELSIVTRERNDAVEELEKVAKERDELQAKVCELKTNGIELLNMKIYKERVLTRLKSIIDDEVDE